MRTLRLSLAGTVMVALLGGFDGAVLAQEDAPTVEPPTDFSGTLDCPVHSEMGKSKHVVVGPLDYDNLVRREWRGGYFVFEVEEMSDPRLDGTLTAYLDRDEYIYPSVDWRSPPALMSATMRIENEDGAWQGSAPDAYMPGGPLSTWGLVPLAGEGAYEGLTAVWWTNIEDAECSCENPENPCVYDVSGAVFHGEMPALPSAEQ